jgi:hypothetical protein
MTTGSKLRKPSETNKLKNLKKKSDKAVEVVKEFAEGESWNKSLSKAKMHSNDFVIPSDSLFTQALYDQGLTPDYMSKQFKKLMKAKSLKIDKNGEVHEMDDFTVRHKALELWAKLTGAFAPTKSESKQLNVSIDMNEDEIDKLFSKAAKIRADQKGSQE